ncbi:MAG: winged helix-turn-helix transcriptional regulator [Emcibacter sp.]|nr:winged helix-turn-helix transcriptional regulator [Emcibacter sp.]
MENDGTSSNSLCPEGRISQPTVIRDGQTVINIGSYIPFYLFVLNNALSRGSSQYYIDTFGIGIVEWRVISMLAIEPRIPASSICQILSLDKASTSRALKRLHGLSYLEFEASKADPRRKVWWLNDTGTALHNRVIVAALKRENRLIKGVKADDLETFLNVMRTMKDNIEDISE